MSILIDNLVKVKHEITVQINDNWYIAKPLPLRIIQQKYRDLKDAIRVLTGKSFAVHYKEDE